MAHETTPEAQQLSWVIHDLHETYGDEAVVIEPVMTTDEASRHRLLDAGVGLVEIMLRNSLVLTDAYIFGHTSYTRALEQIDAAETAGDLPGGSFVRAVYNIRDGEFDDQWGAYLPTP